MLEIFADILVVVFCISHNILSSYERYKDEDGAYTHAHTVVI